MTFKERMVAVERGPRQGKWQVFGPMPGFGRRGRRSIGCVVTCVALSLIYLPTLAAAQDRFEIQVYDSQTAPPMALGLEVHINYDAKGATQGTDDGELPTDRVSRYTLEPHLGLADWCELGGYFQTALRPEGRFDYAGVKLRFKARLLRPVANLIGLAVNTEISAIPRAYEASRFGSEVRPIADLRYRRLYVSFNPILSIDFAGPLAGHPQFQPATKLSLDVIKGLALGVEHYAGLGPIDGLLSASRQTHFVYAALDWTSSLFDLNLAGGRGFGQADPWVVKAIVGVHWEPQDAAHPSLAARTRHVSR